MRAFSLQAHAAGWFMAAMLIAACPVARAELPAQIPVPAMGESKLVFDSNPAYINDHTMVQAQDGTWHMIGITHDKVLDGKLPVPNQEDEFAHASAPNLFGPWTALPHVLKVDLRLLETHVWAPHIVFNDGLYYCFYAGGGGHWTSMINLATSPDLMSWTRHPADPLFRGFYDARDPMVLRLADQWVMYYTKTYSATEWYSAVAYRLSPDLIHWGDPQFAIVLKTLPIRVPNSGQTESPFVVPYNGLYYLFVCTPDLGYRVTVVYVSDDPLHFEEKNEVATLVAHCAEVVRDGDKYYLSHAGWFFDGVYLAPLAWKEARRFSPGFLFADSGDNDDYLASAPGSRAVARGLYQALRAGAGQAIEYVFQVPAGVTGVNLAFEESGACRALAGGKVVLDDGGQAGEPEVHAIDVADSSPWKDGELRVRFEDAGSGEERLAVSWVKIYFR
ncbi:MAG TPA: family 43 glycosylhydrolase [bacterium]|nr:family 43 glycosylhydrolase [bacterium]